MDQNKPTPMVMGCFGLGLSRIITLVVETLSINDEMRWPVKLAPYTVCIIPPKVGKIKNIAVHLLKNVLCYYLEIYRLEAKKKVHLYILNSYLRYSTNAILIQYWTIARITRLVND